MSPRNYHAKFSDHNSDGWWHFSGGPKHLSRNKNKKEKRNKIKTFFLKFKKNQNKISDFK
jgi:hypothetical protein